VSEKIPSRTETLVTPTKELTRGTTFAGRYEIIEELGRGGMGKVYRVEDTKIRAEIALKLINPEISSDKKTIERFSNELKMTRMISHRNVCRMFDLGEESGTYFITMEYVAGEDLKSQLRRMGQVPVGKAISIARQIAEGLAEAHRLGVIHRDLKPHNVMIDKEGNARIMDFGIARTLGGRELTGEGVIIGTPDYMSPEQAEGKPADARSDIYSLGVILYEMVTGQVPFEGETPFSVAMKHRTEAPLPPKKLNPQLPDDLNRLTLRCLEKAPEKRYQTADDFLADLARIEAGLPVPERTTSKHKPTVSREITVKFTPKKLFLPALILIVLVAAAVFLWQVLSKKAPASAPKIQNSIAVISFENLTGDSRYDSLIKAVPSLFITKFEAMGFSYVATWERLQDILRQLGKDTEKPIDTETGFAICRKEGIAALVVGKITKAGDVFATDIKVLDVDTKKSLTSATSQGQGEDSILLTQIDDLSSRVVQELGGGLPSTEAVPPVSEMATSSIEAYESYLKGNEAFYKKVLYGEAQKHYLRAVELDPDFVMAHLGLAQTYAQQGNRPALDKAMEKVIAHADRANPKEKLYIQAWSANWVERNPDKCYGIMREITKKYPREKEAHYWVGLNYSQSGRTSYEKAIYEFQTVLELDPHYAGALGDISFTYKLMGDFDKALEYAKRYVAAAPNEPSPLGDYLASLYLRMGQFDLAIEKCQEAISFKPDFNYALGNLVLAYGLKGDYKEALKWADEKISRSTLPMDKADGHLLKAFFEYWTGAFQKTHEDAEESRKAAEAIDSRPFDYWSYLLEGFAHLAQGNLIPAGGCFIQGCDIPMKDSRRPLVHRSTKEYLLGFTDLRQKKTGSTRARLGVMSGFLSEIQDPDDKKYVGSLLDLLRGEVMLGEGSVAEAIPLFEQHPSSYIEGYRVVHYQIDELAEISLSQPETAIARAYEIMGDTDKAIDVLEKLVRFDPGRKSLRLTSPNEYAIAWRLTPPQAYYDLGRLYEKKGINEKARENYRKFLDLWKDADPGQPEVEDARKRLAGLKGQATN